MWKNTVLPGYLLLQSKDCILKTCMSLAGSFIIGDPSKSREPWSSGYGRRLMSQRSWVWILAPFIGRTFFHIYFYENCSDVCLRRPKINETEVGLAHLKQKYKKSWWECLAPLYQLGYIQLPENIMVWFWVILNFSSNIITIKKLFGVRWSTYLSGEHF